MMGRGNVSRTTYEYDGRCYIQTGTGGNQADLKCDYNEGDDDGKRVH